MTVDLDNGNCELKNIAVNPNYQHLGYGSRLLRHVMEAEVPAYPWMFVGTTTPTESFYAQLGFAYFNTVKNSFVNNYQEPIFENGIQCIDMRYLKRRLRP